MVAIGVIYALDRRGLAAGRDFAVVGFDDIADARLIHPPLTTVAVDSRRLGEHAAAILLEQLAGSCRRPAARHRRRPAGRPRLVRRHRLTPTESRLT